MFKERNAIYEDKLNSTLQRVLTGARVYKQHGELL